MTAEQKEEVKEIPVLGVKTREKEICVKVHRGKSRRKICKKKRGITVKVAVTRFPMPRRIELRIKLKDGTEKSVKAHLVSTYNNYAFYFPYASQIDELMPLLKQIQEVKAYEEEQ